VFWLYLRMLPRTAQTLIPATLGIAGLMWARRRFGARPNPRITLTARRGAKLRSGA